MSETICVKGIDIEIEVEHFRGPTPACTNKLPEDCYPAESGEIEWSISENQETLTYEFLLLIIDESQSLWDEIDSAILEHMETQEPDEPKPPEPEPNDYEDRY